MTRSLAAPPLWRSPEDLARPPEARGSAAADEFPFLAAAARLDRRDALRLMGAAAMLAGLSACDSGSSDAALPAPARGEPGHVRGQALHFATTLELDGYGRGALVRSHEGRPVKIEGNPLHPASLGAADAFMQAEILSLYDPDRSQAVREGGRERGWTGLERFWRAERQALEARGGEGLRLLTGPVTSPCLAAQIGALLRILPGARWHQFSPIHDDHAHAGAMLAFGEPVQTRYDLTRARVILALGADLIGPGPAQLRHAHDLQAARRADRPRLYAVESTPSLTGAQADHRLALRPSEIEPFARALAAALDMPAQPVAFEHPLLPVLARDLRAAGPRALVAVGREQPPVLHALAHALNAHLGATGATVLHTAPALARPEMLTDSIQALAREIAAGGVTHLLVLGGNPAYDAPAGLDLARLLATVPVSIHLGLHRDETGAACRWHVPRRHSLEAWGDLRGVDGTVGLVQPASVPRADARTPEELLSLLFGSGLDGRSILRGFWRRERGGPDFEPFWQAALHDGLVSGTASPTRTVTLRPDWDPGPSSGPGPGLELVFAPDPSLWDGRYANNPWLQELPRPLTKITWDNAALIAPETAAAAGLESGQVVRVTLDGREVRAALWVMPGQAPDTLTLPLGYGRSAALSVGGEIGFDAYRLRGGAQPWHAAGAGLTATGERHEFATTQHHNTMAGRDLVRVADLGTLADAAASAPAEPPSLYPEWPYPGPAWGMAIDLDACIGCNACVVACQAENNVPVVGREGVAQAREMHWLRVDRYYAGTADEPATYFQPMLCMHCEKAPCEVVCPVNATVHSSDGLNVMVYNRCIGTRTCSNNCPYKVRRFNWATTSGGGLARPPEASNPEVSIRPRGVMEKCTYCTQRISAARIAAKLEGRPIRDGEAVTACQQACPTQAIVFGDLSDPESAVRRLKASPRDYALLGELNTRPRTTYLAVIANPNPALATDDEAGG